MLGTHLPAATRGERRAGCAPTMNAKEASLAAGGQRHSAAVTTPEEARGGAWRFLNDALKSPTGPGTPSEV